MGTYHNWYKRARPNVTVTATSKHALNDAVVTKLRPRDMELVLAVHAHKSA